IAAGTLFVLPSAIILWVLSFVYVSYGKLGWVAAIFYGLKPAVLGIVAAAVIRIGNKALKNPVMWSVAGATFLAIFFLKVPFPLIIGLAALLGLIGGRFWKEKFLVVRPATNDVGAPPEQEAVLNDDGEGARELKPSLARAVRVLGTCIILWWAPVFLLAAWLSWEHTLVREGLLFSKAAMVTFGGAYAVLPYVSQQAVETQGWLTGPEMLDGLGLAETTPGPLIMVLQFVGFVGGWHHPGNLPRLLAATLGALITTWTTFVPCFLWIFLGAPHIEQLRGNEKLSAALSSVTAAVVGVIANLGVWFGGQVIFSGKEGADWFVILIAVVTFIGIWKWKWDLVPVVLGAGLIGLLRYLIEQL
ncbi:MAG TPA: chromate transporter, partial [Candidatus Saccharimonadales bacterium]|nr:chromate transporter [Candidatus Saccharimonadales bacterium]